MAKRETKRSEEGSDVEHKITITYQLNTAVSIIHPSSDSVLPRVLDSALLVVLITIMVINGFEVLHHVPSNPKCTARIMSVL